ncbi:MAG: hypothetical protein ABH833_01565, partial [Parcubacteria group bacterium]
CGSLPSPSSGNCASNEHGIKCKEIYDNPLQVVHEYIDLGSYTPKVIVARSTAPNDEDRASVDVMIPPTVTIDTLVPPDYCISGPATQVNWIYYDEGGDPQDRYRVQVDNNPDFSSPEKDSGNVNSSAPFYFASGLGFGETYYVQVKVRNHNHVWSAWSSSESFSTPAYAAPNIDFSWTPEDPAVETVVEFSDDSTVYGGSPIWSWDFDCTVEPLECDLSESSDQNPNNVFHIQDDYSINLEISDGLHTCNETQLLSVPAENPIPYWIEVGPWD